MNGWDFRPVAVARFLMNHYVKSAHLRLFSVQMPYIIPNPPPRRKWGYNLYFNRAPRPDCAINLSQSLNDTRQAI